MLAAVSRPAVSTWCRQEDESPLDLVRRLADAGAAGIVLHAGLSPAWLGELPEALVGAELPVIAVESPCPRPRTRRVPFLAASDKEERREAVAQGRAAVDLAAALGARTVVVQLGRLETRDGWTASVRRFRRGRLDRDEVEAQNREHMVLAPRALDQARFGLDPLLEHAGERGITIAVPNRARWFELPDEIDFGVLSADFAGGGLLPWFDPGAAQARATMGHGSFSSALSTFAGKAAGAWLSDAAGLQAGLPWGRGEVDTAAVLAALPAGAARVVHAAPGITRAELEAAIAAGTRVEVTVEDPLATLHRQLGLAVLTDKDLPRVLDFYRDGHDAPAIADYLLGVLDAAAASGRPHPLEDVVIAALLERNADLSRWSTRPIAAALLRHGERRYRPSSGT
jgi:hypothetical protein